MTGSPHHRSITAFVLALALIVAEVGEPIPSQAIESSQPGNPNHLGIAGHAWWLDPEAHGETLFPALDDLGVTTVRIGVDWKRFEPERGEFEWSKYDRVFDELASRNIVIVANFNTIPAWASVDADGCAIESREIHDCQLREDRYPEFRRAIREAVSRYAWIEHWEFWNEPEMWAHFGDTTYVELLRIFHDEAKSINPEIQVAASTLVGPDYIDYIYNVSEAWYGVGNEPWDAIAYHPYNLEGVDSTGEGLPDPIRFDRVLELHEIMARRSDPRMKMWITEYGWHGDVEDQARNLIATLDWMQGQEFIQFAHLHMLHDWHESDPVEHFGLMEIVPDGDGEQRLTPNTEFAPKPIFYDAFRDYPRQGISSFVDRSGVRFFPETGHTVSGRFLGYWEQMGSLRTIGLPLTRPYPRQQSDGTWLLVQDFERVRLEYHPRRQGSEFEVLGTLIGSQVTADRRAEAPFLPLGECVPDESRECFSVTGHSLAYGFLNFWREHGGLARFGYPITEEFEEMNPDTGRKHTVQYFERARFEHHPDLRHSGFEVQLGLLIREDLERQGWIPVDDPRLPTRRQFE